ncbi:MAG: galactokinase family protein [Acidimicrobiales bacterium]
MTTTAADAVRRRGRLSGPVRRGPGRRGTGPGRVNLIGEHTDYNDGFVFPMALPFATAIAAGPGDDETVEITSEVRHLALRSDRRPDDHGRLGSLRARDARGGRPPRPDPGGWRGTIATDIPVGASLSSSAALEVATGLVIGALTGATMSPIDLARAGRQVEHRYFDLRGGLLDQLASTLPTAGAAVLIDCRDLSWRSVALPVDAAVVVMDTGTRRVLAESAYADRQAACAAAADALGLAALRDATFDDLGRLPQDLQRRALHVVSENARTLEAADAAERGDAAGLGRAMSASHRSLRDDYEVSGPALDEIVRVALDRPESFGARMTGGGFAGCAVALVRADAADACLCRGSLGVPTAGMAQPAEAPLELWPVAPSQGAAVVTA